MKQTEITSRAIALEILQSVVRKKQPFDDVMARHQAFALLEKRDRAFIHALVALTLRRLGQIDAVIELCLNQKQALKGPVHDILRLGVAQLLFLGTPEHAAVDTSVELAAAQNPTRPYKGLINAIMRRLTREGAQMVEGQDAARLNVSDWLWLSWRQAYGTARARNIAQAHLGEALTDLSVKENPVAWAEKLGAQLLPTGSLRLMPEMPVTELEGFADGAWWVQDAAAALPVFLMGDVKGKNVFDLCAAPGGKAAQLAARGAHVTAVDRSAKRLERMKENFARLHLEAEIICVDALKFKPAEKADFVLLDAPCSATGTMRRHPDVQRIKTTEDVERMVLLQERLLDHTAAQLVKEGGQILYAVCSLQAPEAEDQIERFLARTPQFKRNPIKAEEQEGLSELITEKGDLRCLPCHWEALGGLDGFYAARLVREKLAN